MTSPSFWIIDPDSGEERLVYYSELEDETVQAFIKPIGGFIFPANMFTLKNLPTVPFYVKDWIPKRGKSMLYGAPKVGKSYLALQLARCIGVGETFLGLPTTKGVVLYVQFELGEEILQYRMKFETKQDYGNVFVGTAFDLFLDTENGRNRLWRALEAIEPGVLILDPKIKMIVGDEDKSAEMLPIRNFLDSVIEGFGCSIFIIDHSGKDESRRGRGSSIWEGWVDSYIQMRKASKKGEPLKVKIMPIYFRHAPLYDEPIVAQLGEDFEFHVVGAGMTIKQKVAEFLKAGKDWIAPKDLFDAEIGENTSVYTALKGLVEEGLVEKEGRGRYRWRG